MKLTYLLVGGDRRQTWLAGLLPGPVGILGVPGLADCPGPAEVLVLPCPASAPGGGIRVETGSLDPETLLPFLRPEARVYGGALGPVGDFLRSKGLEVRDLLEDPWVAAANARLTAEAAVSLAMETLEDSLFGADCAVVGYGRIGKALAQRLGAWGARVRVAARRREVRAEAAQGGFAVCAPEELAGPLTLVFNTVPAPACPPRVWAALGPDCLYVELASPPGGLPEGCRPPLRIVKGNSLPGRILPLGAARVLARGIREAEKKRKDGAELGMRNEVAP